jgi:hypothetical protein
MRQLNFTIAALIIAAALFSTNGRAVGSLDCPAENCSYLPLIGNPPAVVVYELDHSTTRAGTFRFTGDVLASKPVYDVVVVVRDLWSGFEVSEPVVLKASLPGQLNPFDIVTNEDSYFNPSLEARVIDWKTESEQIYRNATIVSVSYEGDYTGMNVTAEIRNDEAKPLLDVKGVIWSTEQFYGIVAVDLADSLAPGETLIFRGFVKGTNNIPSIHVSVQGILQP